MNSVLIGPATRKQVIFAGTCALFVLLTLMIAGPQAHQTLPAIMPFMPMCALTVFTTSGIAAFLLGARFTVTPQPMLGALGGEEFALVLPNTGLEEASAIAEQARLAIMDLSLTAPMPAGRVTVSAGCATNEQNTLSSTNALVQAADAALYDAKRAGRNRVQSVTHRR
ncbi:GGDEF domain-containing protein [Paraburkholderia haematera]|uniref:diguanylate cyclase n=1 Tax=Paraburkholderia haematera TaxID=2793077 RepID=A0ABN7MRV5_9BURK|nr:GGDEF domain-containing protein [Paraburkholderia haematera]CAE6817023.1 hypothetical protein R69888_05929 [Paraburkholderia haematera]